MVTVTISSLNPLKALNPLAVKPPKPLYRRAGQGRYLAPVCVRVAAAVSLCSPGRTLAGFPSVPTGARGVFSGFNGFNGFNTYGN